MSLVITNPVHLEFADLDMARRASLRWLEKARDPENDESETRFCERVAAAILRAIDAQTVGNAR